MKKMLFLFVTLLTIVSCNNGLNKSILEPLTVDELKSNMKKDTTFTDFYSDIQKVRDYIMTSDVTQAKYGDITYKRVNKFKRKFSDTTFVNKMYKETKELYDVQFPSYKNEVDSILTYWKAYKNKYSLDSLVSVKYDRILKQYYLYSKEVKNVNIGFKVTPLKGTIEQLIFKYCIKSKIANDGSMSILNSHRCLASSPIYSARTFYWETDYSDEKYLKNMSSAQVSRDYDFNIEIVEVRMNGENMSEKLDAIPSSVKSALSSKYEFMMDYHASEIIKESIDPNYISFYDFYQKAIAQELKKFDSKVFDMFKEMKDRDDD